MATLTVGQNQAFTTLAAAIAASRDGDVINVMAGTYTNDFSYINTKITIQGVGGPVNLVATVPPPNGKAILDTLTDVTIQGLTFSGCAVPDLNGAGIRQEAGSLVLQNCTFANNQDGILAPGSNNGTETLSIDSCTFTHNGAGDGYSHNIYVGDLKTFTITNSLIQGAVVGHEIKSRAETTVIRNNRIIDGPAGTASYSIDLPDGGNALITGNVIEKGPNAQNDNIIHFGGEGLPYTGSNLTVSGNTVTNDKTDSPVTLVLNQTTTTVNITGNTLLGAQIAQIAVGPSSQTANTYNGTALLDGGTTQLAGGTNAQVITDNNPHTLALGAGEAVQGGGGLLTATGAGHDTIVGGAGGLIYTALSGGDGIQTASGTANTVNLAWAGSTVQSAGSDVINGSTGNDNVAATGNATITGSTGANAYTLLGNDVLYSNGTDTINIGAGAVASVGGGAFLTMTDEGGTLYLDRTDGAEHDKATVTGSVAIKTWSGSGLNLQTAPGSQGAAIDIALGNNFIRSMGADTIQAGSGSDTVQVRNSAQIQGGSGQLAVFSFSETGIATVYGGAGRTSIDGDTGRILFVGGAGDSVLDAKLSQISVVGGAGLLSITASGRETVTGGGGGLQFQSAAGADSISTQAGSLNSITLNDSSTIQSAGHDTLHLTGGGNRVTVTGTADVQSDWGGSNFEIDGTAALTVGGGGTNWAVIGGHGDATVTDSSNQFDASTTGGDLQLTELSRGTADMAAVAGGRASVVGASNGININTDASAATSVTAVCGWVGIGTSGNDTVSTGAGSQWLWAKGQTHVYAGAGSLLAYGFGQTTMTGGSGDITYNDDGGSLNFVGGSGTTMIYGAGGSLNIVAGSGNLTLVGGYASRNFVAGSGQAQVCGGSQSDSFTFGSGQTTVTGGWGRELYSFVNGSGGGADLINGFKVGTDKLSFSGFGPVAPIAGQTADRAGLHLTLSDGTQITLTGLSQLTSSMIG